MLPLLQKRKLFDPADGFAPLADLAELTDSTLARRDGRWWLYLAGQRTTSSEITLFSASLPPGAELGLDGWTVTADPADPGKVAVLAGNARSAPWDRKGGRHCPSYVRGRDPHTGAWVERLYYAGGAADPWGPFSIGFLEWNGATWVDQAAPAFRATEEWQRGSVFEPNLIYHDGKWRMWFVAGSNQGDYLVQGYTESADGRADWSTPRIFAGPELRLFDFQPRAAGEGFEAVFARVWVGSTPAPAGTGLWHCRCATPSPDLAAWSSAVQFLTAEDCGWHSGPWRPSSAREAVGSSRLVVFFNGAYLKPVVRGFPLAFSLGGLVIETS